MMLLSARFEYKQKSSLLQLFSVHVSGRQTVSVHCLKWCIWHMLEMELVCF